MNWDDLVLQTAERFGGTFPHPDTSAAIATVHQRAPNAVERTIDEVANDYANGGINSPWGILRSRVSKITADVQAKATASNTREKAIARAEQWIRNTGIHYDRETEILDELFGDHGTLRAHDNAELRIRILALWHDLRPVGERLEQEHEERMARYRDQPKPERATKTGNLTADELKALAHRKSLLPTVDEIAGILNDDHPGIPNWEAREAAIADTTDAQT